MSTYYATFRDWNRARSAASELLNGGVSPDDLSLVMCHPGHHHRLQGGIKDLSKSVGDATAYVGRADDPERRASQRSRAGIANLTTLEESRISPIDTSDSDTNVESVDQMEDSQGEAERMMQPLDGISFSSHQNDETALSVLTGYPTATERAVAEPSNPFEQADQTLDSLEIIDIPGVGLIIGGGSLATAALDLATAKASLSLETFVSQLTEEGVSAENAKEFQRRFCNGEAILAVTVTPGELDEGAVEEISERNGAENGGLYDTPRY